MNGCVCVSNVRCPVHTTGDWDLNPGPWSEDDIRAAFEALGDETNQDDFMFQIRYNTSTLDAP